MVSGPHAIASAIAAAVSSAARATELQEISPRAPKQPHGEQPDGEAGLGRRECEPGVAGGGAAQAEGGGGESSARRVGELQRCGREQRGAQQHDEEGAEQ